MFRYYQPNITLLPYVDSYWSANGTVDGEQTVRILPDGCVDIVFDWNDVAAAPDIVGTMTRHLDVAYVDSIRMLGIRFRPCGVSAFTRVPINEFTDQRVDISLFDTLFEGCFFEQILGIEREENKIGYIDSYLVSKICEVRTIDRQVLRGVDLIEQTKGTLPISNILDKVCLSERQFERKFKSAVGISPKLFSSVIRFRNAEKMLATATEESLFSIAVDCGYYDHSHLIREYKRFAGDFVIRDRCKAAKFQ